MFAYTKLMQAMAAAGVVSATDPYFNLTTLLLSGNGTNGAQNNTFLDSSTNNFTITRNGNTTQGTFSPFSQTGWGNYFDGSSYITTANNANLNLGSSNFTIEFWIYAPSATSPNGIVSKGNSSSLGSEVWSIEWTNTTGTLGYGSGAFNGWASPIVTGTVTLNAWNHVAVVRNGTTHTLYINGTLASTATASYTVTSAGALYIGTGWYAPGSRYMVGYVSNARIVIGTAVYTSNFTPSTTPLTAITNTQLLTCQSNRFIDNSSNAFAITVNGTPSVQAFSPFAPTAAYSAATNGGSGYFDGSGDYVVTPSNAALSSTLLASDFTIECWMYLTTYPGGGAPIWTNSTSNSDGFSSAYVTSSGTIAIGKVGVNEVASTATVVKNAWNHFATVRSGSTVYLYLNGAQIASGAASTYLNTSSAKPLQIAQSNQSSPSALTGYISCYRVASSALYTGSTYTIPTSVPTAISGTQLLLNFTNGGIIDGTSKNVLETVGNAQISTTQSKWGGGAIYFDGTGDWLYGAASSPNYAFGTGDFTVEMWVYPTSNPANGPGTLIDARNSGTSEGWVIRIFADLSVGFYDGPANTYQQTAASAISLNTWTYLAFKRSGTTLTIYVNGTSAKTATVSSNLGASWPLYIGNNYSAGYTYYGYIADLRITKGYARTISASPTAAFPLQ